MTHDETSIMLNAMRGFGGGFVLSLADAWGRADSANRARLEAAFPELVQSYGPGSAFYRAADKAGREAA